MQSVGSFIQEYYKKNKSHLIHNYPGLNEMRLIDEYCQYSSKKATEILLAPCMDFFTQIEEGKPLEYIQKNAYFYKYNFFVDESVLIPRSETEILVEDATSYIHKNWTEGFSIAEVGTGSFVIGLCVLCEINKPINLVGGDISKEALAISELNKNRLKLRIHPSSKVELKQSDRLNEIDGDFDLIVSNPPYIKRQGDLDGVHHQAHLFEPHLALYLDDDIFETWFNDFFQMAAKKLKARNGRFMMEGHEDSLLELKKIAEKYFSIVEIKMDYTQRNRFLYASI